MAALTCLRALSLIDDWHPSNPEAHAAALSAVLHPLTRLTELTLGCGCCKLTRLPASLTNLRQLRRCCLNTPLLRDAKLPPGDWLAGLQQLMLPAQTAVANRAALSGATQLQWLGLFAGGFEPPDLRNRRAKAFQGLLRVLDELPFLRFFCLETSTCPARAQLASQKREGMRPLPLRPVDSKGDMWQAWTEAGQG